MSYFDSLSTFLWQFSWNLYICTNIITKRLYRHLYFETIRTPLWKSPSVWKLSPNSCKANDYTNNRNNIFLAQIFEQFSIIIVFANLQRSIFSCVAAFAVFLDFGKTNNNYITCVKYKVKYVNTDVIYLFFKSLLYEQQSKPKGCMRCWFI